MSVDWSIVAGIVVALAGLIGVGLTLLTLPGIWFTLLVALLCWWWVDGLYSPWTVGVAFGLGVLAEIVDVAASAAGTTRAGGGRSGAWGSIAGAFVGAIAGSIVFPILGTIVGGVVGAGAGALIGERGIGDRTWREAWTIGRGAMAARFIALAVKTILAGLSAGLLAVAAFVG